MHPKHRSLSLTSSSTAEASSNPDTSSCSNGRVKKNKAIDMTQVDYPPSVLSTKSSALDYLQYSSYKFAPSIPAAAGSLLTCSNSSKANHHGKNALPVLHRKIASSERSFVTDHQSTIASELSTSSTPLDQLSLPSTPSILRSHGSATQKAPLAPTQHMASSKKPSVVSSSSLHSLPLASASRPAPISRPLATTAATSVRDRRLMVLAEGRGVSPEVGICIVHTTGDCTLSQVYGQVAYVHTTQCFHLQLLQKVPDTPSYSRTLHKIHLNDPHKVSRKPYNTCREHTCFSQSHVTRR